MKKGGGAQADCRPSREDRLALLRKYRLLAAWRARKDLSPGAAPMAAGPRETTAGNGPTDRGALRDLAQEFPGALRELDILGLAELLRRIGQLEHALGEGHAGDMAVNTDDGAVDDAVDDAFDDRWMSWVLAYHGLMRAALIIKRASGRTKQLSGTALARALAAARATCTLPVDESFAGAVIRPPGRRLTTVVLTRMAAHFETSATEIGRALFPARRARLDSPH